ncbi:MAG: 6-bladed beta-propeller [Gemmatimonadales bacterium]
MIALLAAALCAAPSADTVRATVTAVISEESPSHPFLIGEISGLAIDAAGRVYVTDFQEPRVLVFATTGEHLATIGRKGQGPGEFQAPTGPVFGPDGALYVRNMTQVARFRPPAAGGIASRFERTFDGPSLAPWRSRLASAIDREGRFYFPLEAGYPDGLTHYAYARYTLDGHYVDSLLVPIYPTSRSSWASVPVAPGTGRVVRGVNTVPFHPWPQWTVLPAGTLLSSAADGVVLAETDAKGKVLRELRLGAGGGAIPPAERAESLAALKRRLDSIPVPLTQVRGMSDEVRERRLPASYPAVRALLAAGAEVWAVRWSPPPLKASTVIDVLSADGRPLRTVVIPAACQSEPAIAVAGRTLACVVTDAETGAQGVAISRLP